MLAKFQIDDSVHTVDAADAIDISIPLNFNGSQPNAFGVEPAKSKPCAAGELIGDTRQGGSCNFEQYTLIPHCNGTHTECVGHITHERISVRDCLKDVFVTALVVTVTPEPAGESSESYSMAYGGDDVVISRKVLERSLTTLLDSKGFRALIVRTMPNDESKLSRQYLETIPPYFTTEAMGFIVESGFDHLLVDVPSIDRLFDEGRLSNHRVFWNVAAGKFETNEKTRRSATITELIYVSNDVADGRYILNLQIAPFAADAAPSRPLLFRVTEN